MFLGTEEFEEKFEVSMAKQKNILVLGSKKGASFGCFDVAYCANLSALYYSDRLRLYGGIVTSVISAGALSHQYYRENVKRMDADQAVLTMTDIYPQNVDTLCSISNIYKNAKCLNSQAVAFLSEEVAGLKQPIIGHESFVGRSLKSKAKVLFHYFKACRRDGSVSPIFRPSTGVVCLLEAIRAHGKNAEYTVDGIGAGDRHLQPDGFLNSAVGGHGGQILQQHVAADVIIIRKLLEFSYPVDVRDVTLDAYVRG